MVNASDRDNIKRDEYGFPINDDGGGESATPDQILVIESIDADERSAKLAQAVAFLAGPNLERLSIGYTDKFDAAAKAALSYITDALRPCQCDECDCDNMDDDDE